MGKRASMFRCQADACGEDWWEWFEWLSREELRDFAHDLECPECGSQDWKLTDASEFAGGMASGEAAYPQWMRWAKTKPEAKDTLGVTDAVARLDRMELTLLELIDALDRARDLQYLGNTYDAVGAREYLVGPGRDPDVVEQRDD